jgi:hypothetical protein
MASWVPYVICQGDHLSKIAARHGFDADAVWNDTHNDDLRARRPDPHILCACDVLYIPAPKPPAWLGVTEGAVNRFTVTVPKVKVSVVCAQDGKPIANAACIIHCPGTQIQATTGGDGLLEFVAPAHVASVMLEIPSQSIVKRLQIGHLDPVEEPSGILQRLRNLGYVPGAAAVLDADAALRLAVKAFQEDKGLTVSGELDDETVARLKSEHKC